jgi:hypothetical protein
MASKTWMVNSETTKGAGKLIIEKKKKEAHRGINILTMVRRVRGKKKPTTNNNKKNRYIERCCLCDTQGNTHTNPRTSRKTTLNSKTETSLEETRQKKGKKELLLY